MKKQKVIAYIDGFNLFYSCLKGTKNKWLDLYSMCNALLKPNQELVAVKYFTALVKSFNKDDARLNNQQIYLKALSLNPKIITKLGYFSTHIVNMPLADDWQKGIIKPISVIKTEEKGTDVNLAVQLVVDAMKNEFDYAMMFSNDSDMAYSIQIAVNDCKKKVGLYIDNHAKSFNILKEQVSYIRRLSSTFLSKHQFPNQIIHNGKIITKPKDW